MAANKGLMTQYILQHLFGPPKTCIIPFVIWVCLFQSGCVSGGKKKGLVTSEGHEQGPHWVFELVLGMGLRLMGVWLSAQKCHVGFRWQGVLKAEGARRSLAAGKGSMKSALSPCLDLYFYLLCIFHIRELLFCFFFHKMKDIFVFCRLAPYQPRSL